MGSRKSEGFEELYRRLEETVARLEEGGLTLEQSLALYEEGIKLAQRCQEMLQQAELKVTKLQEAFAEGMTALGEEIEEYLPREAADLAPEAEAPTEQLPLEGSSG